MAFKSMNSLTQILRNLLWEQHVLMLTQEHAVTLKECVQH